jgi:hypothetical protein
MGLDARNISILYGEWLPHAVNELNARQRKTNSEVAVEADAIWTDNSLLTAGAVAGKVWG